MHYFVLTSSFSLWNCRLFDKIWWKMGDTKIKTQREIKEFFRLFFDFWEDKIMLFNICYGFLGSLWLSGPILPPNLAKNPKNIRLLKVTSRDTTWPKFSNYLTKRSFCQCDYMVWIWRYYLYSNVNYSKYCILMIYMRYIGNLMGGFRI